MTSLRRCLVGALLLLTIGQVFGSEHKTHDFGHVGIDFAVYHTYSYVNESDNNIRVTKIDIQCDCTHVALYDSTAAPGDTLFFRTTFSTKNYYGPTARSFVVSLEGQAADEIEFQHRAIVGQWNYGLKPHPISLFFLPAHVSKKITIRNNEHTRISVSKHEQADDYYEVTIVQSSAVKGEQLSIEVVPRSDLGAGTYLSSFTIAVTVEGGSKPALLTVPVKIVKY